MVPVRPIFDPAHLYFVTTSAIGRIHFFESEVIKRILIESLNFMRVRQWLKLYAFVIMPTIST